nr:MAG TPA: hypothetical protein [Caudoviricetes sp.]
MAIVKLRAECVIAFKIDHDFFKLCYLTDVHLNTPISISVLTAILVTNAQLMVSCRVRHLVLMTPHVVTQYQPLMIFHCINRYLSVTA